MVSAGEALARSALDSAGHVAGRMAVILVLWFLVTTIIDKFRSSKYSSYEPAMGGPRTITAENNLRRAFPDLTDERIMELSNEAVDRYWSENNLADNDQVLLSDAFGEEIFNRIYVEEVVRREKEDDWVTIDYGTREFWLVVLGLDLRYSYTDKEIKRKFKKLSMTHHPDRGGDPDVFKHIKEAYDNLTRR